MWHPIGWFQARQPLIHWCCSVIASCKKIIKIYNNSIHDFVRIRVNCYIQKKKNLSLSSRAITCLTSENLFIIPYSTVKPACNQVQRNFKNLSVPDRCQFKISHLQIHNNDQHRHKIGGASKSKCSSIFLSKNSSSWLLNWREAYKKQTHAQNDYLGGAKIEKMKQSNFPLFSWILHKFNFLLLIIDVAFPASLSQKANFSWLPRTYVFFSSGQGSVLKGK
jgi:hypothetical protein